MYSRARSTPASKASRDRLLATGPSDRVLLPLGRPGDGAREAGAHLGHGRHRAPIRGLRVVVAERAGRDDRQRPPHVIEHDHRTGDEGHQVGDAEVVGGGAGQALDRPHEVVAEEAHGPAPERQGLGRRRHVDPVDGVLDGPEGVGRVEAADLAVLPGLDQLAARPPDHRLRAHADHRVAPQAPLLHGLEQERRPAVAQLQEGADRRLAVGDVGVDQGHLAVPPAHGAQGLDARRDVEPRPAPRRHLEAQPRHLARRVPAPPRAR